MVSQATDVFYVETARDQNGEPLGEFRLVKNGCTYAYAKARSTLCALRDLLNAPRTLEGQTVERWNGDRGVVQSVLFGVLDGTSCVVLLVRKDDDTFDSWSANVCHVVALDQPADTSEVSP